MPVNAKLAQQNFERYTHARDRGHLAYLDKADKCEAFYGGEQWDPAVRRRLAAQGKPVLTINKVLATIGGTVEGEQLNNRIEVTFKPSDGGTTEIAHALTKTWMHIAQRNDMHWKESYVATDGFITGRGFYDIRMDFSESLQGNVKVAVLNPRHVVIDPDADSYDPDGWGEVFITRWMSPDNIALSYSAADAKLLRNRPTSDFMYGYDSMERPVQSFGMQYGLRSHDSGMGDENIQRNIRVIERQYKKRRLVWRFVDRATGDVSNVPENWEEDRIREVAQRHNLHLVRQAHEQIRWTVTADTVVLHDEWSPYKHFTVVPYFPYFRRGKTIGLVENLLGPQEQLNKTSSQELHIVNTTANSGWKVRRGSLKNMTTEELEDRGAETGLVIEYEGDNPNVVDKILPNQVPTGLDRAAFKADNWIKEISGVSDSSRGFDRADVSGRAVEAKQQRSAVNLAKPFDNLRYTHTLLAKRGLHLVQTFYLEPRLMRITGQRPTDEVEEVAVNQVDATGAITNDLTVGIYDAVVTMTPPRDVYDDQQFNEAVRLKEMGVPIPDHWLVEFSHLEDKEQIAKEMRALSGMDSTEAMQQAQERQAQLDAETAQIENEKKRADAYLSTMRAEKLALEMQLEQAQQGGDQKVAAEAQIKLEELAFEREKFQADLALRRQEFQQKAAHDREQLAVQRMTAQAQARAATQQRRSSSNA